MNTKKNLDMRQLPVWLRFTGLLLFSPMLMKLKQPKYVGPQNITNLTNGVRLKQAFPQKLVDSDEMVDDEMVDDEMVDDEMVNDEMIDDETVDDEMVDDEIHGKSTIDIVMRTMQNIPNKNAADTYESAVITSANSLISSLLGHSNDENCHFKKRPAPYSPADNCENDANDEINNDDDMLVSENAHASDKKTTGIAESAILNIATIPTHQKDPVSRMHKHTATQPFSIVFRNQHSCQQDNLIQFNDDRITEITDKQKNNIQQLISTLHTFKWTDHRHAPYLYATVDRNLFLCQFLEMLPICEIKIKHGSNYTYLCAGQIKINYREENCETSPIDQLTPTRNQNSPKYVKFRFSLYSEDYPMLKKLYRVMYTIKTYLAEHNLSTDSEYTTFINYAIDQFRSVFEQFLNERLIHEKQHNNDLSYDAGAAAAAPPSEDETYDLNDPVVYQALFDGNYQECKTFKHIPINKSLPKPTTFKELVDYTYEYGAQLSLFDAYFVVFELSSDEVDGFIAEVFEFLDTKYYLYVNQNFKLIEEYLQGDSENRIFEVIHFINSSLMFVHDFIFCASKMFKYADHVLKLYNKKDKYLLSFESIDKWSGTYKTWAMKKRAEARRKCFHLLNKPRHLITQAAAYNIASSLSIDPLILYSKTASYEEFISYTHYASFAMVAVNPNLKPKQSMQKYCLFVNNYSWPPISYRTKLKWPNNIQMSFDKHLASIVEGTETLQLPFIKHDTITNLSHQEYYKILKSCAILSKFTIIKINMLTTWMNEKTKNAFIKQIKTISIENGAVDESKLAINCVERSLEDADANNQSIDMYTQQYNKNRDEFDDALDKKYCNQSHRFK